MSVVWPVSVPPRKHVVVPGSWPDTGGDIKPVKGPAQLTGGISRLKVTGWLVGFSYYLQDQFF